jgi:hypothetical protein
MNEETQIYNEFSKIRGEVMRIKNKFKHKQDRKEKLNELKKYNRELHEELWKLNR